MIDLINGNALDVPLKARSVHCVITSPPYWGRRDYGQGEKGEIGQEDSLAEFLDNMVQVFREVRRVLRDDGTLWMNLGDSYVDKNLTGVPWRTAFALQDDGWILRADNIWYKPNPLPEPKMDRPTKSHEYIFLMTKKRRGYFYDGDAVREEAEYGRRGWFRSRRYENNHSVNNSDLDHGVLDWVHADRPEFGRNRRTVWTIPIQPYRGGHFASFPEELAEICLKAGTSERGVCPRCGAPWKRLTRDLFRPQPNLTDPVRKAEELDASSGWAGSSRGTLDVETIGWSPTCDHDDPAVPATVLDIFSGTGRAAKTARKFGRRGIGIDLSMPYLMDSRRYLGLEDLDAFNSGRGLQTEEEDFTDLPLFR